MKMSFPPQNIVNFFLEKIIFTRMKNIVQYRNTLYWDAALKSKNLGISTCIKHDFWPLLDSQVFDFKCGIKTVFQK